MTALTSAVLRGSTTASGRHRVSDEASYSYSARSYARHSTLASPSSARRSEMKLSVAVATMSPPGSHAITSLPELGPPVPEHGKALAHARDLGQVDCCGEHHLFLARLRQRDAPRVDHGGVAAEVIPPLRAGGVGRHHEALVLDRAGTHENLPVLQARMRPLGGQEHQQRSIVHQAAEQLGEAQVVADGQARPSPRSAANHNLVARGDETVLVHDRERVELLIAGHEPALRAHQDQDVME